MGVVDAPARIAGAAGGERLGDLARGVIEAVTLRGGFNTSVVVIGVALLGLAAGVTGTFALLRKRSLVTDAASHAMLPGIVCAFLGAGLFGLSGRSVPVLLVGAAVSAWVGIVCINVIVSRTRLREDAAVGIVLSVFFGAGVVGLSYVQANAPTGAAGLNTLIFGQTAAMLPRDAVLMGTIAGVSLLVTAALFKEFTLVCFNEPFARVGGWPVGAIDLVMMSLVVGVTVAGLQAVGLILVVSLLIIPPVTARFWTGRLVGLVVVSGAIGAVSGAVGAALSASLPRAPAGSVIVLTAGAVFVVSVLFAPRSGVLGGVVRLGLRRLKVESDHLLESAFERGGSAIDAAALREIARGRGWSSWTRRVVTAWLRTRGMIGVSGGTVMLTERGAERGRRVSRNHALWTEYLVRYADVAHTHADYSVDQIEHVLSAEQAAELERELGPEAGFEVGRDGGGEGRRP